MRIGSDIDAGSHQLDWWYKIVFKASPLHSPEQKGVNTPLADALEVANFVVEILQAVYVKENTYQR